MSKSYLCNYDYDNELNIKINKHKTEEKIDKSITSIYNNQFDIPDLYEQIKEMKEFNF